MRVNPPRGPVTIAALLLTALLPLGSIPRCGAQNQIRVVEILATKTALQNRSTSESHADLQGGRRSTIQNQAKKEDLTGTDPFTASLSSQEGWREVPGLGPRAQPALRNLV